MFRHLNNSINYAKLIEIQSKGQTLNLETPKSKVKPNQKGHKVKKISKIRNFYRHH